MLGIVGLDDDDNDDDDNEQHCIFRNQFECV